MHFFDNKAKISAALFTVQAQDPDMQNGCKKYQ